MSLISLLGNNNWNIKCKYTVSRYFLVVYTFFAHLTAFWQHPPPIVRWVLDSVSSKSCTSFPAHCDSCLGTSPEKASGTRRPSGPSGHFHFPFGIVDGVADVISRHFFHDGSSSRSGGHIGSPIRNTVTIRETDGRTHFATLRRLIIDYFFEMFFIDFTKLFSLS